MKKFVVLISFYFCASGIIYAQSGTIGTLRWSIANGELSVAGNGAVSNYNILLTAPWYAHRSTITSIRIDEGVTAIGAYAFYNLSMAKSLFISSTVNTINIYAFYETYKYLTEVVIDPNNTAFCAEDGTLFDRDKTILYTCSGTREGKYIIPETVTTIIEYAFMNRKISSVTIPASVSHFNNSTFSNCSNLTEIIDKKPTPQTLGSSVFSGLNFTNCILRVPAGSEGLYAAAATWKQFKNIVPIEAEISKLTLTQGNIYLLPGNTTMVSAIESGAVTWKSSDETVATVNSTGTLTAIKAGSTVITASLGSIEADCTVTVIVSGNSTIKGIVDTGGTENVRVNLYIKMGEKGEAGETKKGILGGYVLLATTIPNDNGEYKFENLPEGFYKLDVEIDEYESEATPTINLSDSETRSNINFEVDEATGTVVPKILTGVVETWHAASLQIYPNPFTDIVRIAVETGRAPSLQMQVVNTAGAIVHTQTIISPEETIHLGHLPAGLYFIRLENHGMVKTEKIIKIQ